ncbi:hypothetical protein MMC34_007130 [Xylographa carneopallida]|nr:hypothetical protein [Xylographa carneopallida]
MRPTFLTPNPLLSIAILLPSLTSAINLDCENIVTDGTHFNLKPLGGPHEVAMVQDHPPTKLNTFFKFNICARLVKKEGPKEDDCPTGTNVCAIQYRLDEDGQPEEKPFGVIPIAGQYTTSGGGNLDVQYTRLKTSSSHSDSQQEGLRMEMHGGKYEKRKQKAVIELLCSKSGDGATEKRDEDEGSGDQKKTLKEVVEDGQGGRIKLLSYEDVEGVDVLRLQWNTKYACENIESEAPKQSGGWGFFSWFFFILFLSLLAYLILGSYLNYNRYGARGWDLLPHGDTIRDIPYIMQDWFRKVVDTLQGGHTRGGYSAV